MHDKSNQHVTFKKFPKPMSLKSFGFHSIKFKELVSFSKKFPPSETLPLLIIDAITNHCNYYNSSLQLLQQRQQLILQFLEKFPFIDKGISSNSCPYLLPLSSIIPTVDSSIHFIFVLVSSVPSVSKGTQAFS